MAWGDRRADTVRGRLTPRGARQPRAVLAGGALLAAGVLLAVVATAWGSSGGDPVGWKSLGPAGGHVNAIAIGPRDSKTVYVGTRDGLLKSVDGGGSWKHVDPPSTSRNINAVAVDPQHPQTLYAGIWSLLDETGVFKSTDGGESWHGAGLEDRAVRWLTVDPRRPQRVYAVADYAVYRSTDGGGSWQAAGKGLPAPEDGGIGELVVDPLAPATLYALGTNGELFKSTDTAKTWRTITPAAGGVNAIAVDARTRGLLYAALDRGVVYTSNNGGRSWQAASSKGFQGFGRALAVDGSRPRTVYAVTRVLSPTAPTFVLKSTNGGESWAAAGRKLEPGFEMLAVGPDGRAVYTGTDGDGLFRCDACRSITSPAASGPRVVGRAGRGLERASVSSFALDPTSRQTVYAGTSLGVFASGDAGRSWHRTAASPGAVFALAIDAKQRRTLYAVTKTGVLKTTDAGRHWAASAAGLTGDVSSVAADPKTPTTLYAGNVAGRVFKTTDGGKRWRPSGRLGSSNVSEFAIDPTSPRTLYASSQGSGVFKSTDGGGHWQTVNTGLADLDVAVLAIDPAHPQTLYAGTFGGGENGGLLRGVFVTPNGGRSWRRAGTGKVQGDSVTTLAVDPARPGAVYAGTMGSGVYRKAADATAWVPFNTGLQNLDIWGLEFDPRTRTLHVGTTAGAYTITIQKR